MPTTIEICLRLGAALLLGGLIGLERQLRLGLGGIRVYTLVSFGSALFVLSGAMAPDHDYSRMASQAVTGIGFLCAGMIFKHGIGVRGLNQAATIWSTSAVGVLSGAGLFVPAGLGAVGILFVHLVMRTFSQELEARLYDSSSDLLHYVVEAECRTNYVDNLRLQLSSEIASDGPVRLVGFASETIGDEGYQKVRVDYISTMNAEDEMQKLVSHAGVNDAVRSIRWKRLPTENGTVT